MLKQRRKIILASRSKARLKLLRDLGLNVGVEYADIDESMKRGESVASHVKRLAVSKARKVSCGKSAPVVIGVDTVINFRGRILGKPKNKKEAAKFLRMLSGKWHEVYSGVAFIDTKSGKMISKVVVSRVKFSKLSKDAIEWYVATGEPTHAAGAYSIQGLGLLLTEEIDGCFSNIIGISTSLVLKVLKKFKAI